MSAFVAGLLLLLAGLDPLGSWLVKQYPIQERRLPTGAAADFGARTILADSRFLSTVYRDPQHSKVWSSCMLVHEAVHLKENTRREDIPNVFAYMCLDRLGAPGWMKDYLYGLIEADLRAAADRQAAAAAAAGAD